MKTKLLAAAAFAVAIMGPPAAIAASGVQVLTAYERTAALQPVDVVVAVAIAKSADLLELSAGVKQDLQAASAPPADPVRTLAADHRVRAVARDRESIAYHLRL